MAQTQPPSMMFDGAQKNYHITCPFCFKQFDHDEVHFRMDTCFDSVSSGIGGVRGNLQRNFGSDGGSGVDTEQKRRAALLYQPDPAYEQYWGNFGGTTEKSKKADLDRGRKSYEMPIIDPKNPDHQVALSRDSSTGQYELEDGDGMVYAVRDYLDQISRTRVCPHCHNPLPKDYGKFPVKFIAVIGITSSGKTVYLSQLLKTLDTELAKIDMCCSPDRNMEIFYTEDNAVARGKPLPGATVDGRLAQPLFCTLTQRTRTGLVNNTLVFYDIAGENCVDLNAMEKYGRFVTHADGVILLLDPEQVGFVQGEEEKKQQAKKVLDTLRDCYASSRMDQQFQIPVAVCVSKSDTFADDMDPEACEVAKRNVTVAEVGHKKAFNATEYNILQECLQRRLEHNAIDNSLSMGYAHYNYFAFSALGCGVEKVPASEMEEQYDGWNGQVLPGDSIRLQDMPYMEQPAPTAQQNEISRPIDVPRPKRVAEPLFWLLFKMGGFVESNEKIRLPRWRENFDTMKEVKATGIMGMLGRKKYVKRDQSEIDQYHYEEKCYYEKK